MAWVTGQHQDAPEGTNVFGTHTNGVVIWYEPDPPDPPDTTSGALAGGEHRAHGRHRGSET